MKHAVSFRSGFWLLICGVVIALLGCSADRDEDADKHQAQTADASNRSGVSLTPEQIEKGGIKTHPAEAATYVPLAHGFAAVLAHDAIAQSVSDVMTAAAAEQESKLALARVAGLAKTPGAFSAETLEAAQHQAQVDEAAYTLARRKLSASWGNQAPWGDDVHNEVLVKIASGTSQLVRVTFPFGSLGANAPRQLTFTSLAPEQASQSWTSSSVWNAPADASIPGRSLFALLSGTPLSEGERMDAWAPASESVSGAVVPASAVIIYDGQSWCYVEDAPGHFRRRAIDAQRTLQSGYFTQTTVQAGDAIAVSGAALLLAREINPDTESE